MPASGKITIVLIAGDRLVRADVRAGRGADCQIYRRSRPAADDLPSLVEAALGAGPKRAGRVLVLCSEFWTQTLGLSAATTAGMSPQEIGQALAFEVEPFSGIAALDSQLRHVALPAEDDQRFFWVTQVPLAVQEELEHTVRQAGGRLLGLAHPAGLPEPISAECSARHPWRRVELWPESVVCLHREATSPLQMHVVNSVPQPGAWQQEAEGWLGRFGPSGFCEVLVAAEAASAFDAPGWLAGGEQPEVATAGSAVLDFDDDPALQRWLAAWAGQASARSPQVPLIRPEPKPIPDSTRLAIGGVIGAVVLAACVGHYLWTGAQQEGIAHELAALEQPAEQLADLEKQTEELEGKLATIESETATLQTDVDHCRQALSAQRQRVARLLNALARSAPENYVIQSISSDHDGLRVKGVCTDPKNANALAMAIDRQLRPLGLRVHLPEKEAQLAATGTGAYVFDLLIQDLAELDEAEPAHATPVPEGASSRETTAAGLQREGTPRRGEGAQDPEDNKPTEPRPEA
jgi:hypothetical protein